LLRRRPGPCRSSALELGRAARLGSPKGGSREAALRSAAGSAQRRAKQSEAA
jgi:hypothetical protein